MENVCKMDCHTCGLQDGVENKALCATLFLPAMLNRVAAQLQRVEAVLASAPGLNEVVLDNEVKQNKMKKDESIEGKDNK